MPKLLQAGTMRKLAKVALGLGLTAAVLGQTVPRAPVVRVRPPGGVPAPTPVADPTGIYVGSATVRDSGFPGVFNQTWRITLKSQPCPDCDTGQHYFHSTSFDGLRYSTGETEQGGVYGYVNPSGKILEGDLFAVNCAFINPSSSRRSARYFAGSFGEAPGPALVAKDGRMAGRVSGRNCFGRLVTADVSLQRTAEVAQNCPSPVSGTYQGVFSNNCGGAGSGTITVDSSGCIFGALFHDSFGNPSTAVEGTSTSATTASLRLKFLPPCTGTATGSATVNSAGVVTGSYSGTSICCTGQVIGSFTLTR